MKFLHTADLHLWSDLKSHIDDASVRKGRNLEIQRTAFSLFDYAENNGFDAVLIAGDVFDDGAKIAESHVRDFLAKVEKCALPVYLIAGNHDGSVFSKLEKKPSNLYLFGDVWMSYDLGNGVVLYGENEKDTPDPAPDMDKEKVNVVLYHGDDFSVFKNASIDYLAMGHYHAFDDTRDAGIRGRAVYAGVPEGRGFDECGDKGFVSVTVDGGKVNYAFVPVASRKIHAIKLDVSDCANNVALAGKARDVLADVPNQDVVKLILVGETDERFAVDTDALTSEVLSRFFFAKVKNQTKMRIDYDAYVEDTSLKGFFVNAVKNDGSLSEEEKNTILRHGFEAMRGEEVTL